MLSVIATELWLSAVVDIEVTVGAVVSELLLELSEDEVELSEESSEESSEDEVVLSVLAVVSLSSSDSAHEETSTAMLTIRTNQDNKLFKLSFIENVKEVGLKSHKFKLFNPLIYSQILNINLPNSFYNNIKQLSKINSLDQACIISCWII